MGYEGRGETSPPSRIYHSPTDGQFTENFLGLIGQYDYSGHYDNCVDSGQHY